MGMEVGVQFARGMFGKPGKDQTPGGFVKDIAIDPVTQRRMLLQIG